MLNDPFNVVDGVINQLGVCVHHVFEAKVIPALGIINDQVLTSPLSFSVTVLVAVDHKAQIICLLTVAFCSVGAAVKLNV